MISVAAIIAYASEWSIASRVASSPKTAAYPSELARPSASRETGARYGCVDIQTSAARGSATATPR